MAPLWELCSEGKLAKVKKALAKGEDVNGRGYNWTGLMWAVQLKHNSVVRLLLEQPTVDLNCTNTNDCTALHLAADDDNVEEVQLLLDDPRFSSVNPQKNNGETAVMVAVLQNNENALRELVGRPSVDLDILDKEGRGLEELTNQSITLVELTNQSSKVG